MVSPTAEVIQKFIELRTSNATLAEIAGATGFSTGTVSLYLHIHMPDYERYNQKKSIEVTEKLKKKMIRLKRKNYPNWKIAMELDTLPSKVSKILRENMPDYEEYNQRDKYHFTEEEIQRIIKLRELPATYNDIASFLAKGEQYCDTMSYQTVRTLLLQHFPETIHYNQKTGRKG